MKLRLEGAESLNPSQKTCLAIFAEQEKLLGRSPLERNKEFQAYLSIILKDQARKVLSESLETFKFGSVFVIVCQLPQKKGLDRLDRLRLAAHRVTELLRSRSQDKAAFSLIECTPEECRAVAEGVLIGSYEFNKFKSDKKDKSLKEVSIICSAGRTKEWIALLEEVQVICQNINRSRDLVNEPGSSLDPRVFAQYAADLGKELGLSVKIRDEKQLLKEKFTGLWTVGKGSDRPPRMVTLSYDGTKAGKKAAGKAEKMPHLCLVGKGVTFDTGGISIKPSTGMWEMKSDMAGAATALCALSAIAGLRLPVRVSAVLCLAENRPGNNSVLPGDIFVAKNGKTIMVDNTDAEGRLVLTDGLAEAGLLGATHIVDLATLTGSIIRALGPYIAGLFSNTKPWADNIRMAGERVGEKFCEMPLEAEYREYLEDPVADMKNIGKPEAGAITAALFLEEFIPSGSIWAHLDIAGTAFTTCNWKYFKPGATGWGVKSLVELARSLDGSYISAT